MATKVLFLRIPAEMHTAIAKLADSQDRTINKQAIRLLRKALK